MEERKEKLKSKIRGDEEVLWILPKEEEGDETIYIEIISEELL